MKHEIKLPRKIKVGGHDYSIQFGCKQDVELALDAHMADANHNAQHLRFSTDLIPQQMSQSFVHECLHAIDYVYQRQKLTEDQVWTISEGLFQIFEQLGIRFVRPEAK